MAGKRGQKTVIKLLKNKKQSKLINITTSCSVWKAIAGPRTTSLADCIPVRGTYEGKQLSYDRTLGQRSSVLCFCRVSRGEEKCHYGSVFQYLVLKSLTRAGILSQTTTQLTSLLNCGLNYISSPVLTATTIFTYCNHQASIKLFINAYPRKFELSSPLLYNKIPDPSLVVFTRVRT